MRGSRNACEALCVGESLSVRRISSGSAHFAWVSAVARHDVDDDATDHLRRPEQVPAGIARLIECWSETPAVVEGRYTDVLAANALATALAPYYVVGTNLARATFLDPRVRDMYGDWEEITESAVAGLRALVGPDVEDPRLNELIGELSVRSERFRQLWARHDARPKRSSSTSISHPQVGLLELSYEKLPIPETDRMTLSSTTPNPAARRPKSSPCSAA